jgi:outer membrane protein assembly factor BamB
LAQRSSLDYAQWRGNNRDGEASGFIEPKAWPETLTRRWKVDVGEGYGTPLVIGSTIYVFTRREGQEVLTALAADSGRELWRTGYAAPYEASPPTAVHGAGPKATPLFHEDKVFTVGISGIVAGFDARNGALLWRTPAPSEPPYFSAASSLAGDNGIVIGHPGNYGPLTAFDSSTGTVKWTAGEGGLWASPIITTLGGIKQVISATQRNIVAVSLPEGKVLWQYPYVNSGAVTPVLHKDTIIISGLDLGVAAIRPAKRDGKWIVSTVWETKSVSMYLSNPVVIDDALYGLSHRANGQYFALDANTGATLWLGPPRQAANTAVVKAGGHLFLLNDTAELVVARGNRSALTPIRTYVVADSATWAQPAISGQRLFVKDVSSLTLWMLQ